jgi:hypothetical protein
MTEPTAAYITAPPLPRESGVVYCGNNARPGEFCLLVE